MKWEEISKLFIQYYDVNNDRLIIKLDQHKIPQLSITKKSNRKRYNDFEIHFTDKNVKLSSREMNATDLLIQFIKLVGIEQVKALQLKTINGRDLITETNDSGKKRHQINGNYIFTKTGTPDKINIIRRIINELKIKAQIIDI